MKQITEDYVSYEIAKLLKEKGFDEICTTEYDMPDGENIILQKWCINNGEVKNSELIKEACTASTHQMALKWLREVHNIDVDIDAFFSMLGIKKYAAYISTYKPYQLTDTDKEFSITEEEVCGRLIQNKRNTRIPDKGELIPAHEYFDSYEKAVEAALLYVLKNLI